MQYKVALEMIQEVVQPEEDDEEPILDGDKEKEEVVEKRDAQLSADDFQTDRKRRDQGDQTKSNSPKRGR
ncbi:MAG: hypothetical protein OYM47_04820 [Gemmatimonadota bacterium]|nr:hypothetical protein [Gemmatimonadota bacterium]